MRLGTVMVVSFTSRVGARAGGGGQGQSAKVLNLAPWFRMHGQAPQPGGAQPTSNCSISNNGWTGKSDMQVVIGGAAFSEWLAM